MAFRLTLISSEFRSEMSSCVGEAGGVWYSWKFCLQLMPLYESVVWNLVLTCWFWLNACRLWFDCDVCLLLGKCQMVLDCGVVSCVRSFYVVDKDDFWWRIVKLWLFRFLYFHYCFVKSWCLFVRFEYFLSVLGSDVNFLLCHIHWGTIPWCAHE